MSEAHPYREVSTTLLRPNPTPYKALVRVEDSDGLGFFRDAGFHSTMKGATKAARDLARQLDREITSNTRLIDANCRPVSITWGTNYYPWLDEAGRPVEAKLSQ